MHHLREILKSLQKLAIILTIIGGQMTLTFKNIKQWCCETDNQCTMQKVMSFCGVKSIGDLLSKSSKYAKLLVTVRGYLLLLLY